MKPYAFGIDLGGTTVKLGFFNTTGQLLEKWEIPTRKEKSGALILGDISKAVRDKMEEHDICAEDVEGAGIGVPGPVDPKGNVLGCANLGWGVFNVEKALGALTGLKVKAGNDANVAGLGEMWQGGGRGCRNVVMVTLGTGVGGGIIQNGRIVPGIHGAGGEIGHMQVRDDETETCGCGKKGCLEQYTSATGIVRITKRYLAANPDAKTSLKENGEISAKLVFDEAKKGDEVAKKMVHEAGQMLGKALASIACVADPEVFVIGGGVSRAGAILTDEIGAEYKKYAFRACKDTGIRLAELGNDAGIYGAVKMILKKR